MAPPSLVGILLIVLAVVEPSVINAFVCQSLLPLFSPQHYERRLYAKDDSNHDNDDEIRRRNEQRRMERMADIRAVQNIFYSNNNDSNNNSGSTDDDNESSSSPSLDYDTGIYYNLPLWREKLGHTELPGRSLLGFIKDPQYTHMFETLLRSSSCNSDDDDTNLYFGQLRMNNDDVGINVNAAGTLPVGYTPPSPQETDMKTPLHSWKDRSTNDEAVVVGTLMKINDHVRLDDGRLMLHLYAVERFVVMEPKRLLPYPIADVMVLPDDEEIALNSNEIGSAVQSTLLNWNQYEFDSTIRFPIERHDDDTIMSLVEVLMSCGEDLMAKMIPFAPYKYSCLDEEGSGQTVDSNSKANESTQRSSKYDAPDISELNRYNVIREVTSYNLEQAEKTLNSVAMSQTSEIEYDLWILIDEYVKLREVTNVFPKQLLCLLPRGIEWPEDFSLYKLASAHAGVADDNDSFGFVADRKDYPDQRRQKRLSYACTALLGGPVSDHPLLNRTMRRRLLEIPSTKGRLWAARELFEAYNSQFR